MQRVVTVHFNALPETIRKRFVDCIQGREEPKPLLESRRPWIGALVGWCILGLGALGLLGGLAFNDLGWDLQGAPLLAVYAPAGVALLWSCIAFVRRIRLQKSLPFPPGTYLFRLDLVEAKGPKLRILPMSKLSDFGATHHHTNGVYTFTEMRMTFEGGGRSVFNVKGKALVDTALAELRGTREAIAAALARDDVSALQNMDPFFGLDVDKVADDRRAAEEPISDTSEAVAHGVRPLGRRRAMVYTLLGIALGAGIWAGRNVVSDEMLFAHLKGGAELGGADGASGAESSLGGGADVWEYEKYWRTAGCICARFERCCCRPRRFGRRGAKTRSRPFAIS